MRGMNSDTISKINLVLKINNKGSVSCQLKRHLSPMTVGLITRKLPLKGNAHKMGEYAIYFQTEINSGAERKSVDFKKGDIAFLPTGGCICFFINNTNNGKPMSIIGKIIDGIDELNVVKTSDVLSISSG